MTVEINKSEVEVPDGCNNLLELLGLLKMDGPGIAVAVSNRVVPRTKWSDTELAERMKIMVIHAVCGG